MRCPDLPDCQHCHDRRASVRHNVKREWKSEPAKWRWLCAGCHRHFVDTGGFPLLGRIGPTWRANKEGNRGVGSTSVGWVNKTAAIERAAMGAQYPEEGE